MAELTMTRGDDRLISVTLNFPSEEITFAESDVVTFTAALRYGDPALITKTAVFTPGSKVAFVELTPEGTNLLARRQTRLVYDFELTSDEDGPWTVDSGTITLLPDVGGTGPVG